MRELMARLGHATPTVALRYQHATLERDTAIADKLGALLRGAESSDDGAEVVEMAGNAIRYSACFRAGRDAHERENTLTTFPLVRAGVGGGT